MTLQIKDVFEGAAGVRSIIYIVLFVASIFSMYFGMQGAITAAAAQSLKADTVSEANKEEVDTLDDRVDLLEYQTAEALKVQASQTKAITELTKLTIQIATKLNVDTGG
jgi:hypothetical protein